jgi:hypothetical protein
MFLSKDKYNMRRLDLIVPARTEYVYYLSYFYYGLSIGILVGCFITGFHLAEYILT